MKEYNVYTGLGDFKFTFTGFWRWVKLTRVTDLRSGSQRQIKDFLVKYNRKMYVGSDITGGLLVTIARQKAGSGNELSIQRGASLARATIKRIEPV